MENYIPEKSAYLASYIARGAAQPFVWGQNDCALWASGWVAERRSAGPLVAFCGTYATEDECRAVVAENGGLLRLIERAFGFAGLSRGPAEIGSVGIIGTLLGPTVMISLGGGQWIGKAPRGVRTLRASSDNVWSV